jgi:hypothetical protein
MTQHFRFTLAAFAFLLTIPFHEVLLYGWHPLWVAVERLDLREPTWGCFASRPDWVTVPVFSVALGLPFAGFLLSAATVLRSSRRNRAPAVSPALAALVGGLAVFGVGSAVLATSFDPRQVPWVMLHVVPLWAVRLRPSRWLPLSLSFVLVCAIFFGVSARHFAGLREQQARDAAAQPYRMQNFGENNAY